MQGFKQRSHSYKIFLTSALSGSLWLLDQTGLWGTKCKQRDQSGGYSNNPGGEDGGWTQGVGRGNGEKRLDKSGNSMGVLCQWLWGLFCNEILKSFIIVPILCTNLESWLVYKCNSDGWILHLYGKLCSRPHFLSSGSVVYIFHPS